MIQPGFLAFFSILYIGILFAIAWYGDTRARQGSPLPYRGVIYSLSLAVYCTSWTYYGAVGKASTAGWAFFSIYLGPILLFWLGYGFLKKVARICREQNITTIADFISSRYGKSGHLAVIVALVAIFGTMPYIALQLKAVALSYDVLTSGAVTDSQGVSALSLADDTAFFVAALMAVFTILFGSRYVNASEQHTGIILAIAFESVAKLLALLGVCLLAVYGVHGGFGPLLEAVHANSQFDQSLLNPSLSNDFFTVSFISQTLLAAAAIFCLPRQFHVGFVENRNDHQLKVAVWLFPLYLLLTCLLVVPITLSGALMFHGQSADPDMYVLTIPLLAGQQGIAFLAFIGGFSAATGMVIVSVITLSAMVCNGIVMPLLFKLKWLNLRRRKDLTGLLLLVRRAAIILILSLSYTYYQFIRDVGTLASIGLIAFVAAIQFAPAIIGGVYWQTGHRRGATVGLVVGFVVWFYTLFLPTFSDAGLLAGDFVERGLFAISALKPHALFGVEGLDPIAHGALWSLALNIFCYLCFSWQARANLTDRMQASELTQRAENKPVLERSLPNRVAISVGELRLLADKFLGKQHSEKLFSDYATPRNISLSPSDIASNEMIRFTENLLVGAIGAPSARRMIELALVKKDLRLEEIVTLVGEASQAVQFNQSLLNATIENIDQGISVVDMDMRLVAWNQRYLDIFMYPPGFIYLNQPIVEVIRYNAERGECGPGSVEMHIEKRVNYMRSGNAHIFHRVRSDGSVLEIRGNPMPDGGFVTSFSDITAHKLIEQKLIEAKDTLEQRVDERTEALRNAIDSKMRFLAAVNHDMMQPLNAARLYTSALMQKYSDSDRLVERISNSLRSAEDIMKTLLDISRLDSRAIKTNIEVFPINDVLKILTNEFSVIAAQRDLVLRVVPCSLRVRSDAHLLRRMLQNFISNALRHASGRVLIGCRRAELDSQNPVLKIQVLDDGVGIAIADRERIFDEFERLDNQPSDQQEKGLGLGLAIVRRISEIFNYPIDVQSVPAKGTLFAVSVPISQLEQSPQADVSSAQTRDGETRARSISGMRVLCIDNDDNVLTAMIAALEGWGCKVLAAASLNEALDKLDTLSEPFVPDIMLVDYHLDTGETGVCTMAALQNYWVTEVPGILITADMTEKIKQEALAAGYRELRKPVNPGALRTLLFRYYQQRRLQRNRH